MYLSLSIIWKISSKLKFYLFSPVVNEKSS